MSEVKENKTLPLALLFPHERNTYKVACRAGLWYNKRVKILLPERCYQHPQAWANLLRRFTVDTLSLWPEDSNPVEKRCTGICGRSLPATPEFFPRKSLARDGLNAQCKQCKNAKDKEWRNRPDVHARKLSHDKSYRDRPEVQERLKTYRRRPDVREKSLLYLKTRYNNDSEFRERTLERNRAYRNTQEYRERHRTRYQNDAEYRSRLLAQQKERYRNPEIRERILARNRAYLSCPEVRERKRATDKVYSTAYRNVPKNQERKRVWSKDYLSRADIQDHRMSYNQSYYQRPDVQARSRNKSLHRIALKKSIAGVHTTAQIQEQLKRQRYRCYYAACGYSKFQRQHGKYVYQVEHTYPISRVVTTDIPANDMSYLVLACPSCNRRKGNKFPWEFPEGGRLL